MEPTFYDTEAGIDRTYGSNVGDVVPYVGCVFISGETQRSLEAGYSVIVLLGIEAAEPKIVEQLGVVHAHLQETSEEQSKKRFECLRILGLRLKTVTEIRCFAKHRIQYSTHL